MEFQNLIYQKIQDVVKIILNRPQVLNALNMDLLDELKQALNQAEHDPEVRAVVITGAGEKAFCAGADLKEFSSVAQLPSHQRIMHFRERAERGLRSIQNLIWSMSKPVIAMVKGYCIGGGFELALSCDLIIASSNAQFGFGEIRVGLIPGAGGTQILPRLIGIKRASEMIFTGSRISAEEAYRLGIVNKVVDASELESELQRLIQQIREVSPYALTQAKQAILKSQEMGLSAGLRSENEAFMRCVLSRDFEEGTLAFVQKRKPVFKS